jgi:hypothetical protein
MEPGTFWIGRIVRAGIAVVACLVLASAAAGQQDTVPPKRLDAVLGFAPAEHNAAEFERFNGAARHDLTRVSRELTSSQVFI